MNTSQLKKFAQAARVKLIQQVTAKLYFVLTHDTAKLKDWASTIGKLRNEIASIGKAALIDKVAYTWFNRFVAIRFMDVNGFQPLGYNVMTPQNNQVSPQILDEAHAGHIAEELPVAKQEVMDLLDGRAPSSNPDNDAYRLLLVASCNHLSSILPFLFERINDYTELLLPDDLTSNFSIVKDVVDGMSEEDCKEVEIIGWLYQFYISQRKEEVFASKTAVKKEDIPAATQLFTPRWIVEYMVQNTVGKLWLQNKPNSTLKQFMPYYIESPSSQSEDYLKVNSVEEIKLLDQACGSGHILVYGFELFYKIYEEEGYNNTDIPQLIIEKNLYGFELDERAAQLAGMALMMKAREYYRRFFKKEIKPNILYFKDLKLKEEVIADVFKQLSITLTDELHGDLKNMLQATNFGSLIKPKTPIKQLEKVLDTFITKEATADIFLRHKIVEIIDSLKQLLLLHRSFHCIVNNPPYMGSRRMNPLLNKFVSNNLPNSKADLMSCFMERALSSLLPHGRVSMINFQSWMFLSSFEELRKLILESYYISSLIHIGRGVFGSDSGTVVFTIQNSKNYEGKSKFLRVFEREVQVESNEIKKNRFLNHQYDEYLIKQKDLLALPGNPISYWITKGSLNSYVEGKKLSDIADVKMGLATGDNSLFVRFWYEVEKNKTKRLCKKEDILNSDEKWFPYNKGGDYKKWYGNQELIINWKDNGLDIKELKKKQLAEGKITANNSKCWNESQYFLPSLSWTKVSYDLSVRYYPEGFTFDIGGCSIFTKEEDRLFILGLLNSKLVKPLLGPISPTVNFEPGQLKTFPIHQSYKLHLNEISEIVKVILNLNIEEFDLSEINWSFKCNGVIKEGKRSSLDIEEAYELYSQYWKNKFFRLHRNEEELNRQFIGIYGLQDELTPDIPLEDITILKGETSIENSQLVFHTDEVFAQFISYAVGCMFGRYSLDKEGLILANQGETLEDHLKKVAKPKEQLTFVPDDDNIIPVLDDEWFEDDIVSSFYGFLKASFGDKNFRKNLTFVEECLGKSIRQYFTKDFYKDHIQRYKKRPIYWMFSSPKGYFNVLIYVHRYSSDTPNIILNSYLREFIEKLELQRRQLENQEASGSAVEQNKARKQIDNVDAMLADCRQYEVEILYTLASERIEIDLDDGVLVNYNKLGKALALVDGLNDPKTKNRVKEFDWIDTTKIK
jgi:N-6 DNA Methylase